MQIAFSEVSRNWTTSPKVSLVIVYFCMILYSFISVYVWHFWLPQEKEVFVLIFRAVVFIYWMILVSYCFILDLGWTELCYIYSKEDLRSICLHIEPSSLAKEFISVKIKKVFINCIVQYSIGNFIFLYMVNI